MGDRQKDYAKHKDHQEDARDKCFLALYAPLDKETPGLE